MLVFETLLTNAKLDPEIFHQVRLEKLQYAALDKLLPPRNWRPDYWQTSASTASGGL